MNIKPPQITESVSELKSLLRKTPVGYQKQRLTALYLFRSGQATTRKQAAALIGVHRKTIGHWLATYASEGLDALLDRDYSPGRPPRLSKEQQELLRAELEKPEGFSSYQQITDYISETFDVQMNYKTVHALIRYKWNAKLKVPRKSHEKKSQKACDTFAANFAITVDNVISQHTSSFQNARLFCQDESRCGLLPVSSRRITMPGVKPIANINYTFENLYLYGAVEPITGESFFLEMPWLNGVCFQVFIDELAKTFPDTLNILVLDNGSFHYAKSLKLPDNIALIFLPPYSPELNPIERLWQDIKAKLFQHTLGTIEEMQDKITQILRNYTKTAIAQITNFKYFTKVANGI